MCRGTGDAGWGCDSWVPAGAGDDAPVAPCWWFGSFADANPSVPVSAALAESRFPDKPNNPACLESRDYFLKCKRGTFTLAVVAKAHLPFPLSFPPARLAPIQQLRECCHQQRKHCLANREASWLS